MVLHEMQPCAIIPDKNFNMYLNWIYQMRMEAWTRSRSAGVAQNAWIQSKRGPDLPSNVKLSLSNRSLWNQFDKYTTEMIITKTGRRMFPSVQLTVTGLEDKAYYSFMLELVEASEHRHKYVNNAEQGGQRGWIEAGPAEAQPGIERRRYMHPDGPAKGSHWQSHTISFSKLKLTNNVQEHRGNILLSSMHKYVPRIWIIRCDDPNTAWDYMNNPSQCFVFDETQFIAVTAYQNDNITRLKIDNNPFAKGFRENGQSSSKRKRHTEDEAPESSTPDEPSSSTTTEETSSRPTSTTSPSTIAEDLSSCSSDFNYGESDHESVPVAKRARLEEAPEAEEPGPRFHRPWTEKPSEASRETSTRTQQVNPYLTAAAFENYRYALYTYQHQIAQYYQNPHYLHPYMGHT